MNTEISLYDTEKLKDKIHTIRGLQVMLDFELAEIYGYSTKRFNEQVKNNIERFDEDFRFQLTNEEIENLRSKKLTSSWGGSRYRPYAFTEQGIYMLMTVLKDELAVTQSKMLIRMFKEMKHFIQNNAHLFVEIDGIKKQANVTVTIFTDPKTKLTAQDIQKFNAQYPTLPVKHSAKMHDRFLIIDQQTLYHIGASLKDLGKKCFAFEVLDNSLIPHILQNV